MTELVYAQKDPALLKTLLNRRSVSGKMLTTPGPTPQEIETILQAAMRVPDHGKLSPWWFIVFEGEDRAAFGDVLKNAWAARDPHATEAKLNDEAMRLQRVPLVIAVISSPRESTIPVWEQVLSAGAVCHTINLAANALGYGSAWLSHWYSTDENVRTALKLRAHENVAGFIYIGTPMGAVEERDRPAPAKLINHDFADAVHRGDDYAKQGLGYIGGKMFTAWRDIR